MTWPQKKKKPTGTISHVNQNKYDSVMCDDDNDNDNKSKTI